MPALMSGNLCLFSRPVFCKAILTFSTSRLARVKEGSVMRASKPPSSQNIEERMRRGLPKKLPIAGVENTVLVASGKGGVGKSTVAVNLALATAAHGHRVGLLDADVYGPSVPIMMNLDGLPEVDEKNLMIPLVNYGVKCMSMGFLTDMSQPIVWRGLMVMSAIQKMLREVAWGPLDYLFIDMPPGTGDTQLSITQNINVNGVLIVTTPQKVALADARKGALMFRKVGIPVLGLVENMSSIKCHHCGASTPVFGSGGADRLGSELGVPVIGRLPLNPQIQETCDDGRPVVVSQPDCDVTSVFMGLSKAVIQATQLAVNVEEEHR